MARHTLGCWFSICLLAAWHAPSAELSLARFQADVTPPLGSPLCDGLVPAAEKIDDPLSARGIVLLGAGEPIVLCAVDWVGIGNTGYDAWREALAKAAGTKAERVARCRPRPLHPRRTLRGDGSRDCRGRLSLRRRECERLLIAERANRARRTDPEPSDSRAARQRAPDRLRPPS